MNVIDARSVGLGTIVRSLTCWCKGPVSRIEAEACRMPTGGVEEHYRFALDGQRVLHNASDCEIVRTPDGHQRVDASAMALEVVLDQVCVRVREARQES